MMSSVNHLLVSLALVLLSAPPCWAADWPQWLGPARNGTSTEAGDLVTTWGTNGPPVLWSRTIGSGFSSIAIVKGTGYTMTTMDTHVGVVAFDAATGAQRWQTALGDTYTEPSGGDGPRSTPTVDGDRIITLTPKGALVALDRATGELLWTRDLPKELGGQVPEWGYSASPLVSGGLVYLEVGGTDGHGLVAFSRSDGRVVWKHGSYEVSYSSPVLLTIAGARQVVFYTAKKAVATTPEDGQVLWEAPWRFFYGLHVATPLHVPPNGLFVAAGYGVGGTLYDIKRKGKTLEATQRWKSRRMRNRMATSVLVGDHLYGFDEERLTAIEAKSGATDWQRDGFGRGTLIAAGDQLIVLGGDCRLVIVRADPTRYTPIRPPAKVFESERCWTVPTLANGVLYVRNLKTMKALQLRRR
jgi:outer membrane protein assembly factor BamB